MSHYVHFAIWDKKTEKKDLYPLLQDTITDDLIHDDAYDGDEFVHFTSYGDWLALGGRFRNILESDAMQKRISKEEERLNKMYGKNKLSEIIEREHELNEAYCARIINKWLWDKRLNAKQFRKDWVNDETLVFDYVNNDIYSFDKLDYNKVKGHWIAIIDLHI